MYLGSPKIVKACYNVQRYRLEQVSFDEEPRLHAKINIGKGVNVSTSSVASSVS